MALAAKRRPNRPSRRDEPNFELIKPSSEIHTLTRERSEEIKTSITKYKRIPSKFQYDTEQGAEKWLELCSDPLYESYQTSMNLFRNKTEIKEILADLNFKLNETVVNLISFGPGNGKKDREIILGLIETQKTNGFKNPMYYYPYDISEKMIKTACDSMSYEDIINHIKIRGIIADFNDFPIFRHHFECSNTINIFSIIGNTLGNLPDEISFLRQIKIAMSDSDILLLEVRLQNGSRMVAGGRTELRKEFNFDTLKALGIEPLPEKMKYEIVEGRSSIIGTKTIVAKYIDFIFDKTPFKELDVSYIHHYDSDKFVSSLEYELNLSVEVIASDGGIGIFLLRK